MSLGFKRLNIFSEAKQLTFN